MKDCVESGKKEKIERKLREDRNGESHMFVLAFLFLIVQVTRNKQETRLQLLVFFRQ
jgi:hypothetical protein